MTGKSYSSCSMKYRYEEHQDNRENIGKTRQRKTTRKDTGQLEQMAGDEDCNRTDRCQLPEIDNCGGE
jgi:hypothetical protein